MEIKGKEVQECVEYHLKEISLRKAAPEMLGMLKRCRMTFAAILADEQTIRAGLWQGQMLPNIIADLGELIAKASGHATIPAERSLEK
jgi:5-methylthioribose kinase